MECLVWLPVIDLKDLEFTPLGQGVLINIGGWA